MKDDDLPIGANALAQGVQSLYDAGQTDYYLDPLILVDQNSQPVGCIKNGDSVIFCCRRGEREVELTEAFTDPQFSQFDRVPLEDLKFVILTLYHEKFKDLPIAFAPTRIQGTLAEVVSKAGLKQLHTAESEKFAHVTFFFNGGNNQPYPGEEDISIPSPKGIPFDQKPELSLPEVSRQVMEGLEKKYDLIITNFANGDVIGHTANNAAKIECAQLVDEYLENVVEKAISEDYVTFITADHGNLEEMINPDGSPHMAHTGNPVSFIMVDPQDQGTIAVNDGKLADISPTILDAMGLRPDLLMSGSTLIPDHDWHGKRKVLLIILDGWGIGESNEGNPIYLAKTPYWDELVRDYPCSQLRASGEFVGLKDGKPGNSEAGHINMGAGRVILQDDVRLDMALNDGSFYTNEVFLETIKEVKSKGTSLHLLGLLTQKSSHGSIDYPLALLKLAKENDLDQVFLHLIFDGRSTQNGSAPALLADLEERMIEIGIGRVVSGIGRGIALDRDGDYKKIKKAFDLLVNGIGKPCQLMNGA
ncbi:MAG: phosphoglycerate mutase (2,3-diphosphoglycerate-independent) [Anaerolineales bacterium]